jgi:multidrug resistance protein
MTSDSAAPVSERLLLLLLAAVQFTHILDFMIIMPLAPRFLNVFDITPHQFGLLVSVYAFSAAVAGLLMTFQLDRFDRRRALLVLYAGFALSTLFCALASDYPTLLVARAISGVFGGVAGAVVHSIVGDVIPYERRGAATGIIMSAFSISSVAGVPLGLMLSNTWGWRAPFVFLLAASLLVWIVCWRILPPMRGHISAIPKGALHHAWEILLNANHVKAFLLMAAVMFGGFTVIPFLSAYVVSNSGFAESHLPYMYFFGGLATAFSARYIGRLADRHGKQKIFTLVALLSLLPILLLTNLPPLSEPLVIAASVVFMVLVSGRFVPAMALVNSSAESRLRGGFMSLMSAVQNMCAGLAATLAGAIIVRGDNGALTGYWVVGLIACGFTLLAILLARRVRVVS